MLDWPPKQKTNMIGHQFRDDQNRDRRRRRSKSDALNLLYFQPMCNRTPPPSVRCMCNEYLPRHHRDDRFPLSLDDRRPFQRRKKYIKSTFCFSQKVFSEEEEGEENFDLFSASRKKSNEPVRADKQDELRRHHPKVLLVKLCSNLFEID